MVTEKKVHVLIGIIVLLLLLAAGRMTAAFLSKATEEVRNVITVGEIAIELTEEDWRKEIAENTYPGQVLEKNPAVINTGKNPAYIFLEVRIPTKDLIIVGEDGRQKEAEKTAIVSFQANTESWEEISQKEETDHICYVYAYRKVLPPGDRTVELFPSVVMVNYLEGELERQEQFVIDIRAKAIQNGVETAGGTLSEIYEELLKQEEENAEAQI